MEKFLKWMLICGVIVSFVGIWTLISDSMSNSWCQGNEWASRLKSFFNGPVILSCGVALMIWPISRILIKQIKN